MDNWHERHDHAEHAHWTGDDDRDLQPVEADEPDACPYCQATAEEAHQPECPLEAHQSFPKPEPRKRTKGRKQRQEQAVKGLVRTICVERDGYCRIGEWELNPDDWHSDALDHCSDDRSEWAHLGEKKRARTRGMQPEQRHTTAGSLMLCRKHHAAYDAGRLLIVGEDANSPLRFELEKRRVPAGDEVQV